MKDLPPHQIIESDEPPEGDGFMLVFLGRDEEAGIRITKILGTNMTVEEVINDFMSAMNRVVSGDDKKIGLA